MKKLFSALFLLMGIFAFVSSFVFVFADDHSHSVLFSATIMVLYIIGGFLCIAASNNLYNESQEDSI
jgi:hypothetical protein